MSNDDSASQEKIKEFFKLVDQNEVEKVKEFVKAEKIDVDSIDYGNNLCESALHKAAKNGSAEMVHALLEMGAYILIENAFGILPSEYLIPNIELGWFLAKKTRQQIIEDALSAGIIPFFIDIDDETDDEY